MSAEDDTPDLEWDEIVASTTLIEVLRYRRLDETRIYNFRVVAGGAELWRVTEGPGQETRSLKEAEFSDPDEALALLEELRRSLQAGGWREAK